MSAITSSRTAALLVALALAALALVACSAPPRPPLREQDYPGQLRDPASLAAEVLWRQRVTASWGADGQQRGFDAAIQVHAGTLTVMGLSPLGSMGFAIVQRGPDIELHQQAGEELPFPPRFILLDVQRAFYPWLPASPGAASPPDGERRGEVDGESVREIWQGGRLRERRFRRLDDQPPGEIVVRCEWGDGSWLAPVRTVLDNGWFGYRLTVDTTAQTLLAGEGAPR